MVLLQLNTFWFSKWYMKYRVIYKHMMNSVGLFDDEKNQVFPGEKMVIAISQVCHHNNGPTKLLNSATGSQTTILYPLKSQILTFSGQGLQSTPKKKPQVIFSLGNPLGVPPGGMSGITGNLANFCGFCWFLTKRKILFGL